MFCNKCGAELKDGAGFCSKCGAKLEGVNTGVNMAPQNTADVRTSVNITPQVESVNQKQKTNRIVGIAVVAIAAVLVIVVLAALFGGRSYKKVATRYMKDCLSLTTESIEDMFSLLPQEMIDELLDETGMDDLGELAERMENYFKSERKAIEEQKERGIKFSYKIAETEDYSDRELRKLTESFEKQGIELKIKAAKYVTVELTATMDGEKETEEITFSVMKIGRNWYLTTIDLF